MRSVFSLVVRAAIIFICASLVGVALNMASSRPLPWVYEPASQLELSGVTVPLIDEREARKFFGDPGTVFVDTRNEADYLSSHVEGAVFLPPTDVEEKFVAAEALLPRESRLILYCYGPECDMAEEVARFLGQLGYRNMMIMSAGYGAWEKAGLPVARGKRSRNE